MAKSTEVYLCFDLGGTKLKGAYINAQGKILEHYTAAIRQEEGYKGLLKLFSDVAGQLSKRKYKKISVASAGPLHPEKGLLLDPTNFFTGGQSWGVLNLVSSLKKIFKKPVLLENDAAAAVLGEKWKGGHGKTQNIVAVTLGTGVGIGILANGELIRAGRGLHPEASHIPLNLDNKDYPCGCGSFGCIEAYLGGNHFARRLSKLKGGRSLTGLESVALARSGDLDVQKAFKEYGRQLAHSIRALAVLFAPEVVVISGGFSHSSDLFMPETEAHLPKVMERYREGVDLLPKLKISKLQSDAGIMGAAYVANR